MNSGQGVLWIILWICLNSELLRYHGVQNFAKNDTENAELADAQTELAFLNNADISEPSTTTDICKGSRNGIAVEVFVLSGQK